MKANLFTFVRGLKNGTPPRFQSYLKSLTLLLAMVVSVNLWGEDVTLAKWDFTLSSYPSNKTNFTATEGTCKSGSTFYLNGSGSTWNSTKSLYAFTAVTDITITVKAADVIAKGAEITFKVITYYNKDKNAPMKGFNLTCKEGSGSLATTGLSVTSWSLSTSSAEKTVVYTTQNAIAKDGTITLNLTGTGKAGTGEGYMGPITVTMPEASSDYTITYNLTNVSGDEGNPEKTDASGNLELYFYAEDSYSLPENIEVNVGSTTLTSSDYEWEVADEMGLLTLPKAKINGNITITIVGEKSCSTPITISKSTATLPSGCSFSLDKTSGCGDDAGESVLVTCSPATHYTVTAVSSTSGTPGAISNNKCTVSGIKESTTISVTFTETTKYTITFADNLQHTASIPNTTDNKIVVYENETFTFPTIDDKTAATSGTCEQIHYHFMGWVLSTHEGTIAAGDIKTGTSAAVTDAATYYAVWAKEEL